MQEVYILKNRRHQRSLIAGWSDFTGASLDDMQFHIRKWYGDTAIAIANLQKCLDHILLNSDQAYDTERIAGYVESFTDAFYFYLKDFERLIEELQCEVAERHVETVLQIHESSLLEEVRCKHYKQNCLQHVSKDSPIFYDVKWILDETENLLLDYRDFPNFARRLRALVGIKRIDKRSPKDHTEALELKPNVFGIGINLNYLIKQVRTWYRTRKHTKQQNE